MHVATLEATPVSFPYLHREVSSQVARDGVTDIIIRIESDDGCVGWGEACSGADVALGARGDPRDGAVRARQRPVGPRGDPARAVRPRALAVPGGNGELRLGGHRHGARRHGGPCGRPAPVQAVRRPAQARGELLLLPRARDGRGARRAVPRRARGRVRHLLPQDRRRAGGRPRDGRGGARRDRSRAAPAPRRERFAVAPRGRAPARGRWPSTTSTSSSSRSGTTRSGTWPSCARACRCRSARTRGSGARPTRTSASSPGRPTCTASAPTGSARSGRSSASPTSRTWRACRSASTRTASSASRRPPATTWCSRCRTASRGTSRPPR